MALYQNYVAPVGTGTVSYAPDKKDREDQFTLRFDHNFTTTQHFTAYYYFDDDDHTDPFSDFQGVRSGRSGIWGAVQDAGTAVERERDLHDWLDGRE